MKFLENIKIWEEEIPIGAAIWHISPADTVPRTNLKNSVGRHGPDFSDFRELFGAKLDVQMPIS